MRLTSLLARSSRISARAQTLPACAVRFLAFKPEVQSGVAVQSKKKEATDLASVLARELEYEKEEGGSESKLAEIAAAMENFAVEDVAGASRFALTRTVGGLTIRIDVDCMPQETEFEGEDEEAEQEEGEDGADEEDNRPSEGFQALISLKQDGQEIHIGAFITDYLQITRITPYKAGTAPSPDAVFTGNLSPAYTGPLFDDLDEAVQNGWFAWLSERGVGDALCQSISDYAYAKEETEYVRWLEQTRSFVLKK